MNKGKKKQKTRQDEITEVLVDLEKDLSSFKKRKQKSYSST